MFWLYIFPVLFAFPLVLPLCLFFLATGIRVFFSNSSELDHVSCGFERGSTVPLPCFLLPVLPSAHPSVSFLYSPCSFFSGVSASSSSPFPCVLSSLPFCPVLSSPFLFSPLSFLFSACFYAVFPLYVSVFLSFCSTLPRFLPLFFAPLSSLCFYNLFPSVFFSTER